MHALYKNTSLDEPGKAGFAVVCTQRQAAQTMGDVSAVNSISTTSAVDNGLSWSVRLCNKPHNKAVTKAQSIH